MVIAIGGRSTLNYIIKGYKIEKFKEGFLIDVLRRLQISEKGRLSIMNSNKYPQSPNSPFSDLFSMDESI